MRVAMLNLAYPTAEDGRAMLARIPTLTNVCSALARAGADVIVLQRFKRDEDVALDGVHYCLRRDASRETSARPWTPIRSLLSLAQAWRPGVLHVNGLIFPTQVARARALLGRRGRVHLQRRG
jgi:hypothetical protein